MPSVLDLRDVFELIEDTFNNRPLAQQQLIHERHHLMFHLPLAMRDQLDAKFAE